MSRQPSDAWRGGGNAGGKKLHALEQRLEVLEAWHKQARDPHACATPGCAGRRDLVGSEHCPDCGYRIAGLREQSGKLVCAHCGEEAGKEHDCAVEREYRQQAQLHAEFEAVKRERDVAREELRKWISDGAELERELEELLEKQTDLRLCETEGCNVLVSTCFECNTAVMQHEVDGLREELRKRDTLIAMVERAAREIPDRKTRAGVLSDLAALMGGVL